MDSIGMCPIFLKWTDDRAIYSDFKLFTGFTIAAFNA
jgi:hypothetical protein